MVFPFFISIFVALNPYIVRRVLYAIFLLVFPLTQMEGFAVGESTFTSRMKFPITEGNNDAEERADGSMYLNSSDIELCYDIAKKQTIGLRFANIAIPPKTNIKSAYLQFTVDETTAAPCQLKIWIENTANATVYDENNYSVSARDYLAESVTWSPQAWLQSAISDTAQQSPDLSALIQNLINRDDWEAGNALALKVTGEGSRIAVAYEKDPTMAVQLIVEADFPANTEALTNVYINEFMPKNNWVLDEYGEANDWIEIYNANPYEVYLGGLYLSDDSTNLVRWQIQYPLYIAPRSHALIWADNDIEQGPLHTNFKLSASGESIVLTQFHSGLLHIIDQVNYDSIAHDISYARLPDGAQDIALVGRPTPAASNAIYGRLLSAPQIAIPGGQQENAIDVEITHPDSTASIFYTTDGSQPTVSSTRYHQAIRIDTNTVLKTIASKANHLNSTVSTEFYLFQDHGTLPVFHISTNPYNLWDDSLGIYCVGTNGAPKNNYDGYANFFQDWERPAIVSMIDSSGKEVFKNNAGIAIGGNASRKFVQKTFNIHFRDSYGTKPVEFQLFDNRETDKFKHLKLRNGGQDFEKTMLREGLNHNLLINEMDIEALAYRPAVLYLNGQYWGMYGLRESYNDDYIDSYYQVKKSRLNIIRINGRSFTIKEGVGDSYQELYDFMADNNSQQQSVYDTVLSHIDVNEYIDYHIAQIYLANYDWPGNNTMIWNEPGDYKWRWMLFDTDASTNGVWNKSYPEWESLPFITSTTSNKWPNSSNSNLMMRKLFANKDFKNEFTQRFCTYISTIFDEERVHSVVDSTAAMVDVEIDRHIKKWSQEYDFGSGKTCGGSRETWTENVQAYKDFFSQRPEFMRQDLANYFNMAPTYYLHFNYNKTTNGKLYLHQNQWTVPYDYEGEYFSQCPILIEAVADSGYYFSHWKENMDPNPLITYQLSSSDAELTPVFEKDTAANSLSSIHHIKLAMYPNPSHQQNVMLKSELQSITAVKVFDINGRIVWQTDTNAPRLFIMLPSNNWSAGSYLIKVSTTEGIDTKSLIVL